jgi:hypothetical protein
MKSGVKCYHSVKSCVKCHHSVKSGVKCYHSVKNLLSSSLLSKNIQIKRYRIVIFPVVVYGCEPLSIAFREEHDLMVFENRVLTRIIGSTRDEVTGEWRKLHNDELYDVYSLPIIFRVIK